MKQIKTHVRFKGGGFKTEHSDEFAGRDLAEYIGEQFQQKDYTVNSVEYEEPWFTVNVVSGSIEYPLMVSPSTMKEKYWEISCPPTLGFFDRIRGKSEDTEIQNLTTTLDAILHENETITNIKWYSDYSTLTDDYIKKPAVKRLATLSTYLEKIIPPVCVAGCLLAIIGGISGGGPKSILFRIGVIIFVVPLILWFSLFVLNIFVALFNSIKDSFQKKETKKWGSWILALIIIFVLIVLFFLGYFQIPPLEKIMFGAMVLLLFCGMLFCMICGVMSDIQKQQNIKKKFLFLVSFLLILLGFTGFFGGALSSLGVLNWLPNSIEFPLAHIGGIDVNRNGNLFVVSSFYSRIQVYNPEGVFIRGWFLDGTGGGLLKIRINDNNKVEVASVRGRKIDVFDGNGKLLESRKYDADEVDFFDSFEQKGKHLFDKPRRFYYDVEGLVFPRIVQTGPEGEKKIGKNAFYLLPFQGAAQGWAMAFIGIILVNKIEKKKKKKR